MNFVIDIVVDTGDDKFFESDFQDEILAFIEDKGWTCGGKIYELKENVEL